MRTLFLAALLIATLRVAPAATVLWRSAPAGTGIPAFAGGIVAAADAAGTIHGFDRASGTERRRVPLGLGGAGRARWTGTYHGRFTTAATIAGGRVYVPWTERGRARITIIRLGAQGGLLGDIAGTRPIAFERDKVLNASWHGISVRDALVLAVCDRPLFAFARVGPA